MPVCTVSNPTWESSPILNPTPTYVEFDTTTNGTMHFILDNSQTVYFKFYFVALSTNEAINIQIGIYNAQNLSLVSQLTSRTTTIEANIDLLSGTYIVCIRALRGRYQGTAQADYYGYSRTVSFQPNIGEVQQSVSCDLKIDPKRKPCDKDMRWEVVEGTLPKGLVIDEYSGLVHGTLPYLDCVDDEPDNLFKDVPSANMFFTKDNEEMGGVTAYPWGRRWKFKLRISIVDQPEHYDERWFCISIYNNWTRTEQKYLQNYENGVDLGEIIKNIDRPKYTIGLCPVDPCKIDKDVDNTLKSEISDWEGVTIDDEIIYIEIDEKPDNTSFVNASNKIKEKPNTYTVYKNVNGNKFKEKVTLPDDDTTVFCSYVDHNGTIDMDNDVVNLGNVYDSFLAEGLQKGYIQETITIELNNYEEYLSFRTWASYNLNTNDRLEEYKYSKLFSDFIQGKPSVKYEYIFYDPNEGLEGDIDNDSTGLSDEPKHFIYIYYLVEQLPEVKYIEEIQQKEREKGPWDVMIENGETVLFKLN